MLVRTFVIVFTIIIAKIFVITNLPLEGKKSILTKVLDDIEIHKATKIEDSQRDLLNSFVSADATGDTKAQYLIDYLPANYVKDGSRDYTKDIQNALTNCDKLIFPAFPLLINDSGLKVESNKTLTFLKGSELRLLPSSKKSYAILDIQNANNVHIDGPVIIGDRYHHLGTSGEWGMGISIRGSSNVTILNARISYCWGDGIYIGQTDKRKTSQNITVKNSYLKGNRRDGISVISADGLLLENIYAGYTNGTKPMTGINFEPNNEFCVLKNIKVINPRTEYNGSRGIQIGLKHFVGDLKKSSDILIVNHVDIGSPDNAFKMSANLETDSEKLHGYVKIVSPSWFKTRNDVPLNLSSNQANYLTYISSPKVTNREGRILPFVELQSLLSRQSSRAKLKITK